MIAVLETAANVFEPIGAERDYLVSLDGEVRSPVAVVLHESWTAEQRAEFGVFLVDPALPPADRRVASTGYQRINGVVTQVLELAPFDIVAAKATKWEAVKAARNARENGSAPTPFGAVQCDHLSKLNISGLVQMASIAAARSQPFEEEFTLADNSVVLLDAQMAIVTGVAVGRHVSAIHAAARQLRTRIEACSSAEQLAAIDIDAANWP